ETEVNLTRKSSWPYRVDSVGSTSWPASNQNTDSHPELDPSRHQKADSTIVPGQRRWNTATIVGDCRGKLIHKPSRTLYTFLCITFQVSSSKLLSTKSIINKDVYVKQPLSFESDYFPHHVSNSKRGKVDITLFCKSYGSQFIIVQIYVDDIILVLLMTLFVKNSLSSRRTNLK
ncbi:hypothetical protein CR513_47347, partial [Mucuna pruriens]